MKTTASGNPRAPFEVNYIAENGKRAKKKIQKAKSLPIFLLNIKKNPPSLSNLKSTAADAWHFIK